MALNENLKKLKFDKRMNEWNLNQKKVTLEEINQNLQSLEDLSDMAQPILDEEENTSSSSENHSENH